MVKIWKILIIIVVCLGFIGFLSLGYWYKTEGPAMAIDYNTNTEIVCEEPIPVGVAIDETVSFLDEIYQMYQGNTVKEASKQVDALMGAIASKNGKVCDFNTECKAQVGTAGPEAVVRADLSPPVIGAIAPLPPLEYRLTVPACKLKEATGNPCPDLSSFIGRQTPEEWAKNPKLLSLDGLANSLTAQADNVHNLFRGKTAVVPYGLEEKGEVVGETKISKADLVRRYIASTDSWLTPSPLKNTCALSELDRVRISQGKMGDKYPMQCMDALSKEMYTPKAWSEECKDECETFTQECKNCLAKCEGKSVYASLNCKIYSTGKGQGAVNTECDKCFYSKDACLKDIDKKGCGEGCTWGTKNNASADQTETCYTTPQTTTGTDPKCAFIPGQSNKCCGAVCADGFNSACKECLCAGENPNEPLSQEQCLDWICGGSKSNWVCCHEEPIQNPQWYVYDEIFATVPEVSISSGGVINVTDTQLTAPQAYEMAKGVNGAIPEISTAFLMATIFKESSFNSLVGGCNVDTCYYPDPTDDKAAYSIIINELGLTNWINGRNLLSCPGKNKKGEIVGHGGAMGVAQFMPRTWNQYKEKVKEITGETLANPWNIRDGFVASALLLKAKLGWPQSEKNASIAYYGANGFSVFRALCLKNEFQKFINAHCYEEATKNSPQCENSDIRNGKICNMTACLAVKGEYNDCK